MNTGKNTVGVFIDLAKAVDTVSMLLLLKNMEWAGIRAQKLKLFADYLSGRSRCIKINEFVSSDQQWRTPRQFFRFYPFSCIPK